MPEVAPALVEILFLALVFFTLALAFSAQKISQALLGGIIAFLEAIPLIGHGLAGPFRAVDQAVASACGAIVSKCEALVGASFHVFARFTDWLWRQTVAEAAALLHVARLVGDHVYSVSGLRTIVHRLEKVWHGIEHGVRTLTKQYHGIEHRVHKLEHELAAGIGNDVRSEVGSLRRTLHRVTTKTIPRIESEAQAAEADVTALGEYIRTHYLSSATDAVTAAVVVALGALGLGGLRCSTLLGSLSKRGCGLWKGLEDLLGLLIDAVALTHLCDLPKWIDELVSPIFGELTALISSAANSLCAASNPDWASLNVANGPLPPAQTLYLPDHFG
jgi:hypothetical protein